MRRGTRWIDLLDPTTEQLVALAPTTLHPRALEELTRPTEATPRPAIEGHGDYVFGLLVVPVAVPEEDRVYHQEVGFVLTHDHLLTVRKTPPGGEPFDKEPVERVCKMRAHVPPGMIAYHLVDETAEHFLELLDAVDDEVDELDDNVESWPNTQVQRRIADLRRALIEIRRTLGPTREAVRGVVDGRTDLEGRPLFRREVFPRDVELHFAQVYEKLLRAADGVDYARDSIASVRDHHHARIAREQNDVTKRLAVIASLLLFPTLIVGVYGQNFEHLPELGWRHGYAFSWALIVVTTIAQLSLFRWRRWI